MEAADGVALVWFRNDLRLRDNPALSAVLSAGMAPLPVYVHAPDEEAPWLPGSAARAWRRRSLEALDAALRARGSRLHVFAGDSAAILQRVAARTGARRVVWNRSYEPHVSARDDAVRRQLLRAGTRADGHHGNVLREPWSLATRQGDPFRVFTPYWRAARAAWRIPRTAEAPDRLPAFDRLDGELPLSAALSDAAGDDPRLEGWSPGEAGAKAALDTFVSDALAAYGTGRDRPDRALTSRLSPHLRFGEIAPWRVAAVVEAAGLPGAAEAYLRELGWRDFAQHVLHHFPHTTETDFNPRFADFEWAPPDPALLDAWRHGCTGVPIVDAGMRQLQATGWMHNRVRMIVASFLTRHLRMHWLHGARWFWDTLVDADLGNNSLGWQWAAGTGVDAAPYFRIFNPVLQAARFDPAGDYIARWVPELRPCVPAARHAPWLAAGAGHSVPGGYPAQPVVDLAEGRRAALDAFARLRKG